MKITFCGVGEAFDERLANTSLLVTVDGTGGRRTALLDCGFTAAHAFWSLAPDPMGLETVWVSHAHGDHFFGLPLLLLRYAEAGRKYPLTVIGPKSIGEAVTQAMDLAYPGFRAKLGYEVRFFETEPGRTVVSAGMEWSFAPNGHSAPCLAVRLDSGSGSVFYSGDGKPTPETVELARGCDLAVHEAYRVEEEAAGHGNVRGCISFAREAGVPVLALVHMSRSDRSTRFEEIERIIGETTDVEVLFPEPGDMRVVGRSRR
jgi:ribonuclease Z